MMRTLSRRPNEMSVPATTIYFHPRRLDSPRFLLGVGFLAGLLLFCAWMWRQPDHDRHAVRARGNGEIVSGTGEAGAGGVLSDITGDAARSAGTVASGEPESSFFEQEGEGDESALDAEASVEDAYAAGEDDAVDRMAVGENVGAPPAMEEGAALTDGLLDEAPAPAPFAGPDTGPPGAPLLPYYVEVEVAPGQVQLLQLNAESPEHALAILRDFRGDPRVLRGPSTSPLP
jgi:hypothetical protein